MLMMKSSASSRLSAGPALRPSPRSCNGLPSRPSSPLALLATSHQALSAAVASPLRPSLKQQQHLQQQKPLHVTTASVSSVSENFEQPVEAVSKGPKIFAHLRAMLFVLWTSLWSLPLIVVMVLLYPFTMMSDKVKRLSLHFVNCVWAKISTSLFFPVTVEGRENLPPPDKPVMYVANHQSFMDIYSLFHLDRPFKFISKASIFKIPIIGWAMYLTGHVGLERMDTRSQLKCLQQCRDLLDKGAPVLFFPEGTRSPDGVMAGFKKGAFSIAIKSGCDVVPITVLGSGHIMPSGKETQMYAGAVKVIVHAPISVKGKTADQICDESRAVIASSLPKALQGDSKNMRKDA